MGEAARACGGCPHRERAAFPLARDRVAVARTGGRLTARTREELERLVARYGQPLHVRARIRGRFIDPIRRPDRFGEVCMIVRRPSGTLLLSTKDFYPAGAFRLPTGGISHGERVEDALLREAHEETGLSVGIDRFLAWLDYVAEDGDNAIFHTFAFLLEERGGTLGSLDPTERILAYREVRDGDLVAVADALDAVASRPSSEIEGDWADWGQFRAVVHRVVHEALRRISPRGGAASGPRARS